MLLIAWSIVRFEVCLGAIHKGRPHPRGEGVSQKRTHADAGGRGVSGKKRTSSNLNFHQNFLNLNSDIVSCVLEDII